VPDRSALSTFAIEDAQHDAQHDAQNDAQYDADSTVATAAAVVAEAAAAAAAAAVAAVAPIGSPSAACAAAQGAVASAGNWARSRGRISYEEADVSVSAKRLVAEQRRRLGAVVSAIESTGVELYVERDAQCAWPWYAQLPLMTSDDL
jgi:hypothetical protein